MGQDLMNGWRLIETPKAQAKGQAYDPMNGWRVVKSDRTEVPQESLQEPLGKAEQTGRQIVSASLKVPLRQAADPMNGWKRIGQRETAAPIKRQTGARYKKPFTDYLLEEVTDAFKIPALAMQGFNDSPLNPVGLVQRGYNYLKGNGFQTIPERIEPETWYERAAEATGAGAADFGYGRALSMGINALPMVQKGLSSSSKLYRWPAKVINWLSSPGAAEVELGSSVGANVLPAVVNLQYPGEEASGWDKALYYGGNTGLSLAGGLTGGLIAAGKNMFKAGLQGAKQAVKEADVPSSETIYRQGLENTTALDTVLKVQDGIGGISPLPNPAQSDILNYQTITGGLNGAEQVRNSLAGGQNAHAAFSQEITGNRPYSGGNGLQILRSGTDGNPNRAVKSSAERTMAIHASRKGKRTLAGDGGLGKEIQSYIYGGMVDDGVVWKPSETLKNEYTKAGIPAPEFIELPPTQEAARRFRNSISEAKKSMGTKGLSVDVYPVDEYQNMRLFLAKDGLSGVAVKPDGTIVSVFKNDNAPSYSADALMEVAISAGGNKLDAYDTFLPKIYARHGFKVTDRLTWDDQFRPDGWSYDFFKDFNGGRPDVVMMEYDPMYFGEYVRPGAVQMPEVPGATAGQAARVVSEAAAPTPIQTENTSSLLPGEELTPSRLTTKERLSQNPNLTAAQRQAAEGLGEYAVLHNDALIRQSVLDISANPSAVLARLRDKISSGQRFDALDFEQSRQMVSRLFAEGRDEEALNLIKDVSGQASKAGQDVQALSLWSRNTPEGAVKNAQKMVDAYNKLHPEKKITLTGEQANKIRELQKQAMSLPEGDAKNVAIKLALKAQEEIIPSGIGQKIAAWRNIAMLLNPKTAGRNIVGNAAFAGVEKTVTDPLAALIDLGLSPFTGQRTRTLPGLGAYFSGMKEGLQKGVRDVNLGINTRNTGNRFDLNPKAAFKNRALRAMEKALNYALQVPDRAFYEATFKESLQNQMRAAGVKQATSQMVEQAAKEAKEAVFQNDSIISQTTSGIRRLLDEATRKAAKTVGINMSPQAPRLGSLIMPYVQTPANLAQQGLNYSPFGFIKGAANLRAGLQRDASKDFARALIGTGAIGGGYKLAKEGYLTGSLNPSDLSYQEAKRRKDSLALTGIRPYQIQTPWGGVSYSQFAPLSTVLALGAEYAQEKDPTKAVQAVGEQLLDMPFMSGLNRLINTSSQQGLGQGLKSAATDAAGQFFPTFGKQIADAADPYSRETYDPDILKQGLNQIVNKLPFVREKVLPVRLNIEGEPMKTYDSEGGRRLFDAMINPTFINKRKENAVVQEMERLYQATGEAGQFYPLAKKKVYYSDDRGEKAYVALPADVYQQTQKLLGRKNKKMMEYLISTKYYKNLSDEEKVDFIKKKQAKMADQIAVILYGEKKKASRLGKNKAALRIKAKTQSLIDAKIKQIAREEEQ